MTAPLVERKTAKSNALIRGLLDGFLLIGAGVLGYYTGMKGIEFLIPGVLIIVALLALRIGFNTPYYKTLIFFTALAAFNYYYFYCAALNGRNPSDIPQLGGQPATSLEQIQKDIFFGIILTIGFIKLIAYKLENRPLLAKRLTHPFVRAILVLIVYSIFRGGILLFEGETVFNILAYLRINTEYAIIPLVFCTTLIRNEKDLRGIYKGMFYTLGIVSILGIVEFFIEGSPFVKSFYGGQLLHRAASTLQNPNNLGCYLATTMGVFILYFYRNQLRMWERNLFWLTMPLGFACLFMTLSRSAILCFFVTLTISFVILFLTAEREMGKTRLVACRNMMLSYIVVLGLSVFILFKYFDFNNALKDATDLYGEGIGMGTYRTYAFLGIFKMLLQDPGGFFFGYSKLGMKTSPDNALAFLLLRNGILGFLAYAYIWFMGIKVAWQRTMDKKKTHHFLYLVCFYILVFQLLFGFSGRIHDSFPSNAYFWIAIGTLVWLESQSANAYTKVKKEPLKDPLPLQGGGESIPG